MQIKPYSFSAVIIAAALLLNGCKRRPTTTFESLKDETISTQLKSFVAEKEAQANSATNKMRPEFRTFFAAAQRGDWLTVSNMFWDLGRRTGHFEGNGHPDYNLRGTQWEAAKEIWGAFDGFFVGDKKYSSAYAREIIDSIPAGGIYFGGGDPGRFLVTALQKSHVNADPFFTLTQNALCDSNYLEYARVMYGGKIYVPGWDESERCYREYMTDAQRRLKENKLNLGEDVREVDGRIQASGQISVMIINGLLAKVIFDKNPNREFYLEESFPIDWMYPYIEPHHLIMKINREPLAELSDEIVRRDRDYWTKLVVPMIGDWLNEDTSVKTIAAFAEKVFLRHDFEGFSGDRRFVLNGYAHNMFSKERSAIGKLYLWRLGIPAHGGQTPSQYLVKDETERQRMIRAADLAYRQSWALCPYSPEAVYCYVAFLTNQNRFEEATLVVDTTLKFPSDPQTKSQFQDLANRLHQYLQKN